MFKLRFSKKARLKYQLELKRKKRKKILLITIPCLFTLLGGGVAVVFLAFPSLFNKIVKIGGTISCSQKGDLVNGATINVQLSKGAKWNDVTLSGASGWIKSQENNTFTKTDIDAVSSDNVIVSLKGGNQSQLTINVGRGIVLGDVDGDLISGVNVYILLRGDPMPEWSDVYVINGSGWDKENANGVYWFHHNADESYTSDTTFEIGLSNGNILNVSIPAGQDIGVNRTGDLIHVAKINVNLKGTANWNDVSLEDTTTHNLNGWVKMNNGSAHWFEKQDIEAAAQETVEIKYQGVRKGQPIIVPIGNYSRIITTSNQFKDIKIDVDCITNQSNLASTFSYTDLDTNATATIEKTSIKELYIDARSLSLDGVDNVFNYFAEGCTALTKFTWRPPQNIVTAGNLMFHGMFENCMHLTTLSDNFTFFPNASITTFQQRFAEKAFAGCTSLTQLPSGFSLPYTATTYTGNNNQCFFAAEMFEDCTALEKLNDSFTLNLKNNISLGQGVFYKMFYACEKLKKLPDNFLMPENFNLSDSASVDYCYQMFQNCEELENLPNGFTLNGYTGILRNRFASEMFMGCSALKDLPNNFILASNQTYNVGTYVYSNMFKDCPALTNNNNEAPLEIPDITNSSPTYCQGMFSGTTNYAANQWPQSPTPGSQIIISRSS